ncbi:MAG: chromate transporter [Firmicutes bacterium]|jgi:chromate transporter|nr:chromate transporter [Bacillota bacterium]
MLLDLFLTFFKIGLFSFGGGYPILALIQKEIVLIKHWLSMSQFLDVAAISQVTPGPIAINSATFVGYKMAGVVGSIVATIGLVLPSVAIVLTLTWVFLRYRSLAAVKAMFAGIRPTVVALIVAATWVIIPSSLTSLSSAIIALGAFAAIRWAHLDPIWVLVIAAGVGIVVY